MKCLVTGATGFIGPHLVRALQEHGHEVTCLVRASSNRKMLEPLNPRYIEADLRDSHRLAAALAGHEAVFHLAGAVKALSMTELMEINAEGVRRLARACAEQATPPVLVLVSSLAAAGPAPAGRPRQEGDPICPVSNYGRSKRAGELAAREFSGRVPTTIVRPPVVFGPGDTHTFRMFRPISLIGMHPMPGFTPRNISVIHAADLAKALVLAGEQGERLPADGNEDAQETGVYYVSTEPTLTYAQWGRYIADAVEAWRFKARRLPEPLIWAAAGVSDAFARLRGVPSIFGVDKVREATAGSWTCSAAKAQRELGFAPGADLATRLRETAQWYREHGWL